MIDVTRLNDREHQLTMKPGWTEDEWDQAIRALPAEVMFFDYSIADNGDEIMTITSSRGTE